MNVENIGIAVKATGAESAARNINSLSTALEKLEKASASITGLSNLSSLGTIMGTLANNRVSVSVFNSLSKGIENLAASLKAMSDADVNKLTQIANVLSGLNGIDLTGIKGSSGLSRMATSMQRVSSSASSVGSATRGAAKGIEEVAEAADRAKSPLSNFISSLKRIAFYRMLRTIIKEISQAIREGIDNLYEYSKAHDDFGGIASSFDGLASAAQSMKNQLGATFGQILAAAAPILIELMNLVRQLTQLFYPLAQAIAALEPVIVAVINVVTQLVNVLISLFSLLGLNVGKIVADDATKSWKEAKDAAGAYKNTILGFDEINRLNDTSGGGGGSDNGFTGGFEYEPFDFDWKFPEWFALFTHNINIAIGKVKEFCAELALIPETIPVTVDVTVPETIPYPFPYPNPVPYPYPNPYPAPQPVPNPIPNPSPSPVPNPMPSPVPENGIVTVTIAVPEGLPEPLMYLKSLLETNPVIAINLMITGGALAALAALIAAMSKLTSSGPKLQTEFAKAFGAVEGLIENLNKSYEENVQNIQVENSTLGQDVVDTYNRLKNPVGEWVRGVDEKFSEYSQSCGALAVENETLASDMNVTFDAIGKSITTALGNAKTNFDTFITETLPKWGEWMNGVAESIRLGFDNVATNIYNALQNAANNTVSFINGTAQGFVSWVKNTADNIFSWASNVVTNIGNALSSAWTSIKNFAKATGESIGSFFKDNANVIIPAAIGAAIVVGAIALAPATGGASLGAIALAANGGEFPNDGTLFVAGEAGAEIVSNLGNGRTGVTNVEQMEAAVANGNMGVINAVYAMANVIVKAIEEIDPDITLDGESLADKMYSYNQNAQRKRGAAMVT